MRHRYGYLDPEVIKAALAGLDLTRLWNDLVMMAGGDPEQALEWMRQLQAAGHLDPTVDLDAFLASLEDDETVTRAANGKLVLSAVGQRRIRRSAFEEIWNGLARSGAGQHTTTSPGDGGEALPETRRYRFGDELHRIDPMRSVTNSLRRNKGRIELGAEDFEVQETEFMTTSATMVAIDVSYSMVYYGEDRLTPAKKVALALTELIREKYPRDHLEVASFGDQAEPIELSEIATLQAGPYHTNTSDALQLGRQLLGRCRHRNKQIFLITDGHPTAIRDGSGVYKNPWSLDLRIVNKTLEEAEQCRRQKVVITTFMVATDPSLVDFVEKMTRINRGRAYFASPHNLSEFVFADYIRNRRRRVT